MTLPTSEVDRFYKIWRALLLFVNQQKKVVKKFMKPADMDRITANDAFKIRNELWQNDGLLESFAAQNPGQLSPEDLALASSWKYHKTGSFFVFKLLKKHAILIQEGPDQIYAVKGLYSSWDEIIPFTPLLVNTTLLPFGSEIIYDSLFQPYNVTFGSGIRGHLKEIYDDAKERGAIITSLGAAAISLSPQIQSAQAEATNAKVLQAFKKYLFESGKSEKIAKRDLETVRELSQAGLDRAEGVVSLRDLSFEVLEQHLQALPMAERKQAVTGLKRFVQFLRDTGRLDWEFAEELLMGLKTWPPE
jgi:hypothetical protein